MILISEKLALILQRHSFWLSLLIHVLLLLSVTLVFVRAPQHELEKKPALEIPSYLYRSQSQPEQPQVVNNNTLNFKPNDEKKAAISVSEAVKKNASAKTTAKQAYAKLANTNQAKVLRPSKNKQGVHLIGENKVVAPLIKLLGTALSAKLIYPKIAEDFGLSGVALVGFRLHPSGDVTDIQLVKSSTADVLDQAALNAVSAISPLKSAAAYVSEPQFLVIGFIFGTA